MAVNSVDKLQFLSFILGLFKRPKYVVGSPPLSILFDQLISVGESRSFDCCDWRRRSLSSTDIECVSDQCNTITIEASSCAQSYNKNRSTGSGITSGGGGKEEQLHAPPPGAAGRKRETASSPKYFMTNDHKVSFVKFAE